MKIPKALLDLNDRFGDALNHTIYYNGKIDIRVLDVITLLGGVGCVAYYYYAAGIIGAAQGGMMYVFTALCVLWFFSSSKEMSPPQGGVDRNDRNPSGKEMK